MVLVYQMYKEYIGTNVPEKRDGKVQKAKISMI